MSGKEMSRMTKKTKMMASILGKENEMAGKKSMPAMKKAIRKAMDPEVRLIRKGDHSMDQYIPTYKKSTKRVSLTANRRAPHMKRSAIKAKVAKYQKELEPRIKAWKKELGRELDYFELDQVLEAAESAGDISE